MIDHFYQEIEGFFDFEKMYDLALNRVKEKGHFVEIGSWMGKSAAYMAVIIHNSGKNIQFDCIDSMPDQNWSVFEKNLRGLPIKQIRRPSLFSFSLYPDNKLDFVFIDSSHDENTEQEISEWYQKVKSGGIIGGHDYGHHAYPHVKLAVEKIFGENYTLLNGNTWYHIKK